MGYKKAINIVKGYLKNYPDAFTVEDGRFRGTRFYYDFGVGENFISQWRTTNLLKRSSLQDRFFNTIL